MYFTLVILLFSTVKSQTPEYTYASEHLSIEANLVKTGSKGLQNAVFNSLAKAISQVRSLAFVGAKSGIAVDFTKRDPAMGPNTANMLNLENRGSAGRDSRLDESPKQKFELPWWFKKTRVSEVNNRWKPFKTSYRTDKTMVSPGFTMPLRSPRPSYRADGPTAKSSPTVIGRRTPPPSGPTVGRKTPSTAGGVPWLPPALEERRSSQARSTRRTTTATRPLTHRTTRPTPRAEHSQPMLWPVSERTAKSPAHVTAARTPQPPTSYESQSPPPVPASSRTGGTGAEKDPFRRFWTLAPPSGKQDDGPGEVVIEGGNPVHARPVQIRAAENRSYRSAVGSMNRICRT